MAQRKYLGLKSLDELAMDYAMVAQPGYASERFVNDSLESQQLEIHRQMVLRFTHYDAQEAIKRAYHTLRIVAFHPE